MSVTSAVAQDTIDFNNATAPASPLTGTQAPSIQTNTSYKSPIPDLSGSGLNLSTPANTQGLTGNIVNPQIPKPTAVVSSGTVTNKVIPQIQGAVNSYAAQQNTPTGYNDVRDSNGLLVNPPGALYDRNTGQPLNPNGQSNNTSTSSTSTTGSSTSTSTPGNPTPEDAIAHDGETQYYNQSTGQAEWVPTPTNGTPPSGYSTTDPKNGAVVSSVQDLNNNTLNQYADGHYGLIDSRGNYSTITPQTYQSAQNADAANTALVNVQKGILSPAQQTQMDQLVAIQAKDMSDLLTKNANITGGQTIAQNMFGMGNNTIGQGEISKTITDGMTRVTQLQAAQAAAVDAMKQSFITQDSNALKSAFDAYNGAVNSITKAIQDTLTQTQQQQNKQDAALLSAGNKADFKYPDAGINPGVDSYDTIQKKILASPSYTNKAKQLGGTLTDDQTEFYAEAGATGTAGLSKLASEFTGFGNVATKNQVLQKIADNAIKVGLSGSDFAAALSDSHAKEQALNFITKQGAQTQVNEKSASAYFDTLNDLATKVDQSVYQTGIPLIDKWIKTGDSNFTGDPATVNFANQLVESMTEYAKVMTGQTSGAAVTDSASATAQSLINQGFNANTIKSFVAVAKHNMADRLTSFNSSANDLKNVLSSTNSTSSGSSSTTSGNTITSSSGKTITLPN